jgi:hypothetical protein
MKFWPIAVLGLTCLLISGCRTDPAIQLLERDNRRLEDEIYRLRACLEDYESGMIVQGGEVVSTRHDNADAERKPNTTPARRPDLPPGATIVPPSVELDQSPANESEGVRSPASGKPPRRLEKNDAPGPTPGGAGEDEAPPFEMKNMSYLPPIKGDNLQVVQIVLHDKLCWADETGMHVVFEARDRHNRRIDASGDVSIALVDPTLVPPSGITPPEAKIARWDYPADAVSSMFRKTNAGNVMSIDASWDGNPPPQKNLMLYVRYKTRDGRNLIAGELPIKIRRTEDRTARVQPPERLQPGVEEHSGPLLVRNEAPDDTPTADSTSEDRRESLRTTSRESSPRLKRPEWSPERR